MSSLFRKPASIEGTWAMMGIIWIVMAFFSRDLLLLGMGTLFCLFAIRLRHKRLKFSVVATHPISD